MSENRVLNDTQIRDHRIANIIFTILATAAFIAALVFFGSGIDALNQPVPEGETNLNGLGFALCFILYLIAGTIAGVFALVSFGISFGGFKQRKGEAVIHLVWNVIIMILFVACLATMLALK